MRDAIEEVIQQDTPEFAGPTQPVTVAQQQHWPVLGLALRANWRGVVSVPAPVYSNVVGILSNMGVGVGLRRLRIGHSRQALPQDSDDPAPVYSNAVRISVPAPVLWRKTSWGVSRWREVAISLLR